MYIIKIGMFLLILFQTACSSMPPINEAIREGNTKEALQLIEDKTNLETTDEFGATPLHFAAANGNLEIIRALVNAGAHIDAQANNKATPLLYACDFGKEEAAKLLIDLGANKDSTNLNGVNCIFAAASNKQTKIIKLMLEKGQSPNSTINNKFTALHASAEIGDIESVKLLLKYGANVDAFGPFDKTPLDIAVKNNKKEVAIMLLQEGAKPHLIDSQKNELSSGIAAQEFLIAAAYNEKTGDTKASLEYYRTAAEQFDKFSKDLDSKASELLAGAASGFAFDMLLEVGTALAGTPYTTFRNPGLLATLSQRSDVKDLAEKSGEQSKLCRAKATELERKVAQEPQKSEGTSILRP